MSSRARRRRRALERRLRAACYPGSPINIEAHWRRVAGVVDPDGEPAPPKRRRAGEVVALAEAAA